MLPHQPMYYACTSSASAWSRRDPPFLPRQACLFLQQKMHELVPFCRDDSTSVPTCSSSILGPFVGCRVGEAKNPGPALPRGQQDIRDFLKQTKKQPAFRQPQAATDSHLFTVGVANPTSVLHKQHELAQVGADLLFLSETSAVSRTQRIMKPLRQERLSVIWGHPVQCHDSEFGPDKSLKGHAARVAILSTGQAPAPVPQMPDSMLATQRLVEAMVRFGPIEVRAIALYGFPRNRSGYLEHNQALLSMALQRVQQSGIPTVIGGDFNMDVAALPAWECLRALGYVEAFQFAADRLARTLPATCRHSTKNDLEHGQICSRSRQMLRPPMPATNRPWFSKYAHVQPHFSCKQLSNIGPSAWSGLLIQPLPQPISRTRPNIRSHVCLNQREVGVKPPNGGGSVSRKRHGLRVVGIIPRQKRPCRLRPG